MTDIQRRPAATLQQLAQQAGVEVVRMPGNQLALTGTLAGVGQLLAVIERTGRLVSSTTPVATGVAGQVLVNVGLAPRVQIHAARQPAPRRKLSPRALWLIVAGVLLLVAGIGWLVYAVMAAIAANLAVALLIVGAVVVVLAKLGVGSEQGKTFSGTFQGKID